VHMSPSAMVAEASRGVETRARKREREDLEAQAGVTFLDLPFDVAVFIAEKLRDPADLAVLRAVSREMRVAVDATGRKVEEMREEDAARRGYLSTLKCLRRRGVLTNERLLCAAAATGGHLEALKSLRRAEKEDESPCAWNDRIPCPYAAFGGHLEVLQWARANDCPWDEGTCWAAASGGHLEVLQWARANGCPWDERTCAYAAEGGHLEVLQWARANGCPWDEKTRRYAASKGYVGP